MHLNLIFPDELGGELNRIAAKLGFGSPEAFIQAAIQNELKRLDSKETVNTTEEELSDTLHRLSEQTRRLAEKHTGPAPLIHSLTNLIFMFKAELEAHTFSKAVSMRSNRRRKRSR